MTGSDAMQGCQPRTLWEQFACPKGWVGWMVGYLLAWKNGERSQWVRTLVAPREGERVLEIGFGPGVDVRWVSRRAAFTAGVDRSATMVRQASGRNREGIRAGRVRLEVGDAARLPFGDGEFDKVFAINSAQFWEGAAYGELLRVLRPGGRAILAVQPRSRGANEETADRMAEGLSAKLAGAGFEAMEVHRRAMKPVSTVCVVGVRPGGGME